MARVELKSLIKKKKSNDSIDNGGRRQRLEKLLEKFDIKARARAHRAVKEHAGQKFDANFLSRVPSSSPDLNALNEFPFIKSNSITLTPLERALCHVASRR